MKKILSILTVMCILLSGCAKKEGKNTANNENTEPVSRTAVMTEGGTVSVTVRKPDTYNPIVTEYESCRELYYLFYDGLFTLSDTFLAVANLAESYTSSADGKSGTLKIKHGITFSDGSPLTAADVYYTVNFIKEHPANYGGCVENIESVTVSGSDTLYISLYEPEHRFETMLTFPIIKENSPEIMTCPVGTGQFRADEADVGYTSLVCRKNTEYHMGRPYLDGFSVRFTNTALKAAASFSSGETDLIAGTELDISSADKVKLYEGRTNRFEFLGFNSSGALFSEDSARRAVYEAIGKMKLSESSEKIAAPSLTPLNPSAWFMDGVQPQEGDDPKNILERNSWKMGASGIYSKDGKALSFKILVNSNDSERIALAKFISGALIEYGISADVETEDYETYKSRIKEGKFDAFIGGAAIGNAANPGFLFKTGKSANVFGYSGGVMDLRIDSLAASGDESVNAEAKKFTKAFAECAPAAGLYFKTMYAAVKKDIVIPAISPTGVYVTAYTWYMTK